jgi:anti-anti-sigma factor
MDLVVSHSTQETRIALPERFVYNQQAGFRRAYTEAPSQAGRRFILDFSRTNYIDSSALGMLLILREEVGGDNADIHMINARPQIRKILETARFHELFKLV